MFVISGPRVRTTPGTTSRTGHDEERSPGDQLQGCRPENFPLPANKHTTIRTNLATTKLSAPICTDFNGFYVRGITPKGLPD
jgi:hypothetical protein